jgi:VWFA-related protein
MAHLSGRRRASWTIAIAALCLVGLTAQTPQPSQAPQTPTFSVGVTLVTTDVIVRDSRGLFVADLTKDDFEVLEDGRPQTVTSFVMVNGGRTYNLLTPPEPAAPQEGIILPGTRPQADPAGRVLIVFVDDAHLEALHTHHLRALLKKVLGTVVHNGDLVAMFTTGTSAVEIPLTYDYKLLQSAVERVTGNGLTFADITSLNEGPSGPANLRQRAANTFSTVYGVINDLDKVRNRRKAVLYISQGYDFDPFPEARRGTDKVFGGRYGQPTRDMIRDETNPFFRSANVFADADLAAQLREITRAANRANATLFTIDPRGLVGTTDAGQQTDSTEWTTHLQRTQSSLRALADATGGTAVVNQNDFEPALKRIDAELSDYYVIGYYSDNPDPRQRVRGIDVKVKRPGLRVTSRSAYSLRPGPTPPQ